MLKNLYGEKRVARTQHELNGILLSHERYVTYRGGMRAQLAHASLDGLILANRILTEADFSGASLVRANLYVARTSSVPAFIVPIFANAICNRPS